MTDLTVDSTAATRRSRGAALFALTALGLMAPATLRVGRDLAALDRARGATPRSLAASVPVFGRLRPSFFERPRTAFGPWRSASWPRRPNPCGSGVPSTILTRPTIR